MTIPEEAPWALSLYGASLVDMLSEFTGEIRQFPEDFPLRSPVVSSPPLLPSPLLLLIYLYLFSVHAIAESTAIYFDS